MSQERNIKWLNNRRVIYKQHPIKDVPTIDNSKYMFFKDGTHEHYSLFNTKAKINTYRSLKWHLLVLRYLNSELDPDNFIKLTHVISDYDKGFITFFVPQELLQKIIQDVNKCDIEDPPKNKIRKFIFKDNCGLTLSEKLSIVGKMIGRNKRIHEDDIYECMLDMHDTGKKITINKLANYLKCSERTIHRNMSSELKQEKELLNETNEKI